MFFDKAWSRKNSDKKTFEQRHECKEGVSWGVFDMLKESREVRGRTGNQRDPGDLM